MKLCRVLLASILIGLCSESVTAQHQGRSSEEQLDFSAEDDSVHHAANIPPDAWKALQTDEHVTNTLKYEGLTANQLPRTWFLASSVHLGDASENDLVVIANDKLAGANITQFWIFMQTSEGLKLVLQTGTHSLSIKSSRSHKHRDIQTYGMTCCELFISRYRFDGIQYQLTKSTAETIK